jgi:hypothetical protein
MRILAAIPHYFAAAGASSPDGRPHGSVRRDPRPRVAALSLCVAALRRLYGPAQHVIDQATRTAPAANQRTTGRVDVVICTTGADHLVDRLPLPPETYAHHRADCAPALLGFECHTVLRDRLGGYDYYAYLEDDLIAHDPWLFVKLGWFTAQLGDDVLLQPNRYEVGPRGLVHKAYIDGDLKAELTAPFQDVSIAPLATGRLLGTTVDFQRAKNPHAGCFFLNGRQMEAWAGQPYFLDRGRGLRPAGHACVAGSERGWNRSGRVDGLESSRYRRLTVRRRRRPASQFGRSAAVETQPFQGSHLDRFSRLGQGARSHGSSPPGSSAFRLGD